MNACDHINTCGFIHNYPANPESVKNGWKLMFCSTHSKSQNCRRKELETKGKVKENFSPSGKTIPFIRKSWE
jgi:hypothetical protein